MKNIVLLLWLTCIIYYPSHAQGHTIDTAKNRDALNFSRQRDAIDILYLILKKGPNKRLVDTVHPKPGKVYFSGALAPAYQLQTGVAGVANGVLAFYLGPDTTTKISAIQPEVQYTQKKQLLVPLRLNVWSRNNQFNFIGDWRFLKYPQDTYGIGGNTKLSDAYTLDYNYVRFYQFILKKISTNFYAGAGVQYDNHWHIKELDPPLNSDFQQYGYSASSISSGVAVNVLYNTVTNMLNPPGGSFYANAIVRQNLSWLGSNTSYSTAIIDVRKFFSVGQKSNVLAFWSYDWLTLSGNPPYLDLPSNGWDTYGNTGRGYTQNRFRGKNMVYMEGEFRFNITRNRLVGGTVFANAESFTGLDNKFSGVLPGAGAGLRVMFNKFSQTHVAIDYAFGKGGSHGVFLSLGEFF